MRARGRENRSESAVYFRYFLRFSCFGLILTHPKIPNFLLFLGCVESVVRAAAAIGWFQRAADRMHMPAMWQLALVYNGGVGTAPDPARAMHWYRSRLHNERFFCLYVYDEEYLITMYTSLVPIGICLCLLQECATILVFMSVYTINVSWVALLVSYIDIIFWYWHILPPSIKQVPHIGSARFKRRVFRDCAAL